MFTMNEKRPVDDNVFFWTVTAIFMIVVFILMAIATRRRQIRLKQEEDIFVKLFQNELNINIE